MKPMVGYMLVMPALIAGAFAAPVTGNIVANHTDGETQRIISSLYLSVQGYTKNISITPFKILYTEEPLLQEQSFRPLLDSEKTDCVESVNKDLKAIADAITAAQTKLGQLPPNSESHDVEGGVANIVTNLLVEIIATMDGVQKALRDFAIHLDLGPLVGAVCGLLQALGKVIEGVLEIVGGLLSTVGGLLGGVLGLVLGLLKALL